MTRCRPRTHEMLCRVPFRLRAESRSRASKAIPVGSPMLCSVRHHARMMPVSRVASFNPRSATSRPRGTLPPGSSGNTGQPWYNPERGPRRSPSRPPRLQLVRRPAQHSARLASASEDRTARQQRMSGRCGSSGSGRRASVGGHGPCDHGDRPGPSVSFRGRHHLYVCFPSSAYSEGDSFRRGSWSGSRPDEGRLLRVTNHCQACCNGRACRTDAVRSDGRSRGSF